MQFRLNLPPLTRILLIVLGGTSIIYQVVRLNDWTPPHDPSFLALVPQWALFRPWVYFTATFAEQNLVTLLIAGITLFYGGKYLERAWDSREFGKFVLLVTVTPNFVASLLYVLWFAITRDDDTAWTTIQGSVALQAAFLVAFKQLVPEHTVTILKGVVKIRVKHFPSIFLVANTLSGFLLGTDTALVLAWLGFLTSWTYLRFYKTQTDLSGASTGGVKIRGDASETFAFAYFWPDVVQPPIAAFADGIYNALVALRICTPFSAEDVESGNEQATARGEGGLPSLLSPGSRRGGGGKREEAERRRALALKALDQRLHAATANRQQPPSTASANPNPSEEQPPTGDSPSEATRS